MRFRVTPRLLRFLFRWFLIGSVFACFCGYLAINIIPTLPEVFSLLTPPPTSPLP